MEFVDTHCHIHMADYPLAVDEIGARAQHNDVTRLICVGTDVDDSRRAVEFVQNRDNCWASVGLHPHEAKEGEAALNGLRELVTSGDKIIAIGECGLDYFYGHSPKPDQEKVLRYQIELALEYNLPIIFHVRDAFDDFWPIFDSYKDLRGVLHSFTDTRQNLDKAVERNLYIGVNGIMTFTKNSLQLDVARATPLHKMLLETDAPFLTPTPLRGKVNEPANALLVANFIAELRHESIEKIAAATTKNARLLFSI